MDAREQGRADLVAWVSAQPQDLYADDDALLALISAHALEPHAARFHAAGETVAGPLDAVVRENNLARNLPVFCLLYTSPSPRDQRGSRMPSSA